MPLSMRSNEEVSFSKVADSVIPKSKMLVIRTTDVMRAMLIMSVRLICPFAFNALILQELNIFSVTLITFWIA